MEALAKPDSEINDDYDFWNAARHLKEPYLKYCRASQNRIRVVLADYRIIAEDEDQATTIRVKGIILKWANRKPMSKQEISELNLELQFLEHHKKEYSELSTDFASISHAPKSKTALENFK